MTHASLRILIAEPTTRRRKILERLLNAQGYFGVVTASSIEEVMKLLCFRFDLLLIEQSLFGSEHSELARRMLDRERCQHVLCYRSDDREPGPIAIKRRRRAFLLSMPGTPDALVLRRVIARVIATNLAA